MKNEIIKNEFALSNDIVRIPNKLSLNNLQILGVILSYFDWKENDDKKIIINVPTSEIIKALSTKSNNYEFYKKEIYKFLITSWLVIDNSTKDGKRISDEYEFDFKCSAFFPNAEVNKDKCSFQLNEELNGYFQQLKINFTIYKIANTVNFTSRFSYVLYINLCSWNDHRIERNDPIDERTRYYTTKQLKEMFDIGENEYTLKQKNGTRKFNRGQFEKRVIEKAVKEINVHTDIQVKWWKEYDGRNVSKYVFWWVRTDGIDERTGLNKI